MPTVDDTSAEAARVQIELLRAAGPARRFQLMRRMTNHAVALSRRAIQRANPDASELEVKLIWAEVHYGPELAAAVRADLKARGRG